MSELDQLCNSQSQLGREIEKFANVFYGDRPSKKNVLYLNEKLNKLQGLWLKFEEQDEKIRKLFQSALPLHEYFTTDYFNVVKKGYNKIASDIKDALDALKGHPNAEHNENQKTETYKEEESFGLVHIQQKLFTNLKSIIDKTKENVKVESKEYYELKSNAIKKYWNEIEQNHKSLCMKDIEFSRTYDWETFFKVQEEVEEVVIKLAENKNAVTRGDKPVATTAKPSVKLPDIQIPKFDGTYLKWQQFHDLFNQIIHMQDIGNSQKMFYLKSNLSGEAEKLIRHIPVTDENYIAAWNLLKDRYSNQRLLVGALLDKLLTQPTIAYDSATSIKTIHDTTMECIVGLENLGLHVLESWDPILLHILTRKLDRNTHNLYEQTLKAPKELQSLKEFLEFLELRFQALESLGQKRIPNQFKTTTLAITENCRKGCKYCSGNHAIYFCEKLLKLPMPEREVAVRKIGLCLNCLKIGHKLEDCSSKGCFKCQRRHNTLLHPSTQSPQRERDVKLMSHLGSASSQGEASYVFLGTAVAFIEDGDGRLLKCRILLDSGSQVSFITERLKRKLNIAGTLNELSLSGIGEMRLKIQDKININLQSKTSRYGTSVEAYVIKEITSAQPQQFIDINNWNVPNNIILADTDFNKPGGIDVLLGAEVYGEIMLNSQVKLGENLPVLQKTTLGWIVLGKATNVTSKVCGLVSLNLEQQLKKFWEQEECSNIPTFSKIDLRCEDFFMATTLRNESGRFTVSMPIFSEPNLLGDSFKMAYKRLISMEKKLAKLPDLKQKYNEFLMEYQSLGHMSEISQSDIPKVHYFLPHQYVLKPESSTTKLRVVFDASAKTSNNLSLNDLMVAGPKIQDDLFDIIMRFRIHKYVFTADITQMYRQILMQEEDRKLQLIMWRHQPNTPIKYFQLNTVTYGTKAAPYLATRCLKQLATDESIRYPSGSRIIRDFYVDDVLTGHDNLTEAIKLKNDLSNLLKSAGFQLRKLCANNERILQGIPQNDLESTLKLNNNDDEHIKALGLAWEPRRDCFLYSANLAAHQEITKRTILSETAQLFDPLGLINPVIVKAKIFIQQLWKSKFEWDQELPNELREKWLKYRSGLRMLNNLKIGRYALIDCNTKNIQLHAFADASELAYGAVIYLRSTNQLGITEVKLLCAKSRVAPIKVITLPRLELCAAMLAGKLVNRIIKIINIKIDNITYWSDSQITIAWIRSDPALLKPYVGGRVQRILELSSPTQWRHIRTNHNPADMLSRGMLVHQLISSELWFWGPSFLREPEEQWPTSQVEVVRLPEEERRVKIVLNCASNTHQEHFISRINHGNSFQKLQRITAMVIRSTKRFKKRKKTQKGIKTQIDKQGETSPLTVKELEEALRMIIAFIQKMAFQEEVKDLRNTAIVKPTSKLTSLTPFLDEDGLIRVGGRLNAANINYDAKHPWLLPGDQVFSKLLMNHLHKYHLHAGPQALLSLSRQRFWITQGRNLARSVVNSCVTCVRVSPQLMKQLMGNLPDKRVLPGRPFLTTGVDFCGLIWTHYNLRGKRPQKTYVAVFVCFVTKAIHLEVVTDLSTDAFIGALKRFMGRRGFCKELYCDNATNFVGANNKLNELVDTLRDKTSQEKIMTSCAQHNTQFNFIPPRAPHFGGLWEAAVKSFKKLFIKTFTSASLTYEELCTATIEIEAMLNSRPLTPMSSNPNDLAALTPGHFLIGEPLTTLSEGEIKSMSACTRWKLVTALRQEFWQRWTIEYLSELQKKIKWTKHQQNIKLNIMVIIKNEKLPPLKWTMGRVIRVTPGQDGSIRVVEIQTATGILKRAIHHICPLPIEASESDMHSLSNEKESEREDKEGSTQRTKLRKRPPEKPKTLPQPKRRSKVKINPVGIAPLASVLSMAPTDDQPRT